MKRTRTSIQFILSRIDKSMCLFSVQTFSSSRNYSYHCMIGLLRTSLTKGWLYHLSTNTYSRGARIRTQIDGVGDRCATIAPHPYNVRIEIFSTLLSFKGLLNLSEFLQLLACKGTCLLNKNNSHEGRNWTYSLLKLEQNWTFVHYQFLASTYHYFLGSLLNGHP